jgi:hypothetical protein
MARLELAMACLRVPLAALWMALATACMAVQQPTERPALREVTPHVDAAVAPGAQAGPPPAALWRPHQSSDFRYQPAAGQPPSVGRRVAAATVVAGSMGTLGLWSYFAWYAKQSKAPFSLADEGWFGARTYAGGADKIGHFYTTYLTTRIIAHELQWGGFSAATSSVVASVLSLGFFVGIEIKDGYHKGFGFSMGDLLCDVLGVAAAQAMLWSPRLDELFDLRIGYWPTLDFTRRVVDGDVDIGEDYSGMDFALWLHLGSLGPASRNPRLWLTHFIDVGIGYATRGFLPLPTDRSTPRQRLPYVGLTFDVAALLDWWLYRRGGAAPTQGLPSTVRRILEFYTLPGLTWRLGPDLQSPQW